MEALNGCKRCNLSDGFIQHIRVDARGWHGRKKQVHLRVSHTDQQHCVPRMIDFGSFASALTHLQSRCNRCRNSLLEQSGEFLAGAQASSSNKNRLKTLVENHKRSIWVYLAAPETEGWIHSGGVYPAKSSLNWGYLAKTEFIQPFVYSRVN